MQIQQQRRRHLRFLEMIATTICILSTVHAVTNVWGNFDNSPQLLHAEDVIYPPSPGTHIIKELSKKFPKNGNGNGIIITGIRAVDHDTNSTGGVATLYSGGPGHNFVNLQIQSQYNYGLKFHVEIYGKKT